MPQRCERRSAAFVTACGRAPGQNARRQLLSGAEPNDYLLVVFLFHVVLRDSAQSMNWPGLIGYV